MLLFMIFIICFSASIAGALCGIGGGVIIKPVLDSFQLLDVTTISFLSGCTVLSMSLYSVLKNKLGVQSKIEQKAMTSLTLGASGGGVFGKWMFGIIISSISNKDKVGAIQAICLLIATIVTLLYALYRHKITAHHITKVTSCVFIGGFLGILSSFLGIGGGPINLVVLYFFFSMNTKNAVKTSLYIILFSQISSLIFSIASGNILTFAFRRF